MREDASFNEIEFIKFIKLTCVWSCFGPSLVNHDLFGKNNLLPFFNAFEFNTNLDYVYINTLWTM